MEIMENMGSELPVPPPTAPPRSKRSVSAEVTESAAQTQPKRTWNAAPWSLFCLTLGVSLLAISVELVLVLAVAAILNRYVVSGLTLIVLLSTIAPIALVLAIRNAPVQ
jgi:hypothetical protein